MTMGHDPAQWGRPTLPSGPFYTRTTAPPAPLGWGPSMAPPNHGWGPPPPMPAPAAWPQQAPVRRSSGIWWLLGVLAVAVVIVLAIAAVVATSRGSVKRSAPVSTTSAPLPAKTVAPLPVAALAGLLPGPNEFAAAAGTGPRAEFHTSDRLFIDHIVDQDCVGAVSVGSDDAYQGSGWMGTRVESLVPAGTNPDGERGAWLAVVSYPDASGAAAMYAKVAADLNRCAGRSVNTRDVTNPADHDYFTRVGRPDEDDGTIVISRTDEGGEGWGCQNATTARNNIVITTGVCGNYIGPEVVQALVDSVVAKVNTQT